MAHGEGDQVDVAVVGRADGSSAHAWGREGVELTHRIGVFGLVLFGDARVSRPCVDCARVDYAAVSDPTCETFCNACVSGKYLTKLSS